MVLESVAAGAAVVVGGGDDDDAAAVAGVGVDVAKAVAAMTVIAAAAVD
jgi:hypothetical protein